MGAGKDRVTPRYSLVVDQLVELGRRGLMIDQAGEIAPVELGDGQDFSTGIGLLHNNMLLAAETIETLTPPAISEETFLMVGEGDLDQGAQTGQGLDLSALDDLIFLAWACGAQGIASSGLYAAQVKEVYGLLEDLSDRFLPFWKLIPLNEQRRAFLQRIRAEHRWQFPWYEEWSELPVEALPLLAEAAAGLLTGPDVPVWVDELLDAVRSDSTYMLYIRDLAHLFEELPDAVADAYALVWQQYGKKVRDRFSLPEGFSLGEGLYLSRELLAEDIAGGLPGVEWRFMAAACVKGLLAEDRLALFEAVEAALKEDHGDLMAASGVFAEVMGLWLDGEIDAEDLLEKVHGGWSERMAARAAVTGVRHLCSRERLLVFIADPERKKVARRLVASAAVRRGGRNLFLLPGSVMLSGMVDESASDRELSGVTPLGQRLFRASFADRYADGYELAAADSSIDGDCRYLLAGQDGAAPTILGVGLKLFGRDYVEGHTLIKGRIDIDPDLPYPENQVCGLITATDHIYCARSFSLDPVDYVFHAEFQIGPEVQGRLRIILGHGEIS